MSPRALTRLAVPAVMTVTLALAACGGGSSSSGGTTTSAGGSAASSAASPSSATSAASSAGSTSAGGGSSSAGSSVSVAPAAQNYDLSFVASIKNEPFFYAMYCGISDESKKLGVTSSYNAGDAFDPAVQTPLFNAVTAQKPDAALVVPVDATAMIPPLQQMKSAGIKIVELDTSVDDKTIAESQIATDNLEGGQLAAKTLADQIGGKGKVLVVNVQPGISSVDARQKGFEDTIASDYPDIEVLPVQFAGFDAAKASSVVNATLSANPDLAGVYATASILGEGTAQALTQSGAAGQVKVVAFDATPTLVQQFDAGNVQAIVTQDPYSIGAQGVQQAVLALEGKPTTPEISTPPIVITKDNVEETKKYFYPTDNCA